MSLFLVVHFCAFTTYLLLKHLKTSKNHNKVFPQPHDKNLYNFVFKLLDIFYFTFFIFEPIDKVVIEISIFGIEI
jgi:hypothetical protein